MRSTLSKASSGRRQRGFALLLVMFLTTLVLLGAMAAAPYVRTERQREKEEDMIWRGKQYVRGIKLFYRKNGRFPTSVDDLVKPKVESLESAERSRAPWRAPMRSRGADLARRVSAKQALLWAHSRTQPPAVPKQAGRAATPQQITQRMRLRAAL